MTKLKMFKFFKKAPNNMIDISDFPNELSSDYRTFQKNLRDSNWEYLITEGNTWGWDQTVTFTLSPAGKEEYSKFKSDRSNNRFKKFFTVVTTLLALATFIINNY